MALTALRERLDRGGATARCARARGANAADTPSTRRSIRCSRRSIARATEYFARPHRERSRGSCERPPRLGPLQREPRPRALALGSVRRIAHLPDRSGAPPGPVARALSRSPRGPGTSSLARPRYGAHGSRCRDDARDSSAAGRPRAGGRAMVKVARLGALRRSVAALRSRAARSSRRDDLDLRPARSGAAIAGNVPARPPAAIRDWIARAGSMRERIGARCVPVRHAEARGWARLLRAPGLLGRVRAGEIDAIACYSAKDFALATFLAAETGSPCRELLAHGTQYFGEFAFELLAVVPYAYWLHRQGRLEHTVSTPDTRCLYWFSPRHEERPSRGATCDHRVPDRRGGLAALRPSPRSPNARHGPWIPPPYRDVYRDERFRWDRPTLRRLQQDDRRAVSLAPRASRTSSADRPPPRAHRHAANRYQVVYNRPRAADIVTDHQAIRELGDIEAVKRGLSPTC